MTTVRHLLEHKGKALFSVQAEDPVLDAIRVMAERRVGALVVMKGNTLQGIISERDYARKVILKGRSSADTPVAHIMTSPATTVTPQQTVQECMKLMTEGRFRHLPVVEAGAVIGMISIGDIVRALMEEQQQTIEQLENYIHR